MYLRTHLWLWLCRLGPGCRILLGGHSLQSQDASGYAHIRSMYQSSGFHDYTILHGLLSFPRRSAHLVEAAECIRNGIGSFGEGRANLQPVFDRFPWFVCRGHSSGLDRLAGMFRIRPSGGTMCMTSCPSARWRRVRPDATISSDGGRKCRAFMRRLMERKTPFFSMVPGRCDIAVQSRARNTASLTIAGS